MVVAALTEEANYMLAGATARMGGLEAILSFMRVG